MSQPRAGTTYRSGAGTALVGTRCALLLSRADDTIVGACWPLIAGGAEVGQIVEALARAGLTSVGDFALVRANTETGPDAVVLVRGAAMVTSVGTEAPRTVDARAVTTWVETEISAPTVRLELATGGGGPILPLTSGVVFADAVELTWSGSPTPATVEPSAVAPVAMAAAPVAEHPPTAIEPVLDAGPGSEPDVASEPPAAEAVSESSGALGLDPIGAVPPAPITAADPFIVGPVPAGAESATGSVAAESGLATLLVPPAGHADPEPDPGPEPSEEAAALAGVPAGTEIDHVDGAGAEVTVSAVRCPYGHLSTPQSPYCRVCATPIAAQEPVTVARPALGLLRLSTGEVIPLDRDVRLGRNPVAADGAAADTAHVVPVPSPNKDISRTHVEVHLEGWSVYITDLGSTNGTLVTIPGQAPIRLEPGQPLLMTANTEVNLAGEVAFRFEVTH